MLRQWAGIFFSLAGIVGASAQTAFQIHPLAGSNPAGDGGAAAQAVLLQAEGVAVASDGTVFIADAGAHRVRAVSPGGEIRTVAGNGQAGFSGDSGPAPQARLNAPYGLALDRQGNLYIADLGNARIRVVSPDGQIRTAAGGGEIDAGEASEGSAATALRFKSPRDVLADGSGGFYFSDFEGHRVYAVDSRGVLTILAGTGNPGYGADNIAATRSALRNPAGLALEPLGGLVIVESGSQRLRRVARGVIAPYLADALRGYPLYSPTGIAFDPAGNLYLADARATGALKRSPNGEMTALPVSGRAVAADPRGGAYYAGPAGVYRVDTANKAVLAAGGTAGAGEFTGDGGPAPAARLLAPSGLAYDGAGNLYIADEGAHRVRRISPDGRIVTVAGTGRPAYTGDGGPASAASLNAPRGLAVDSAGSLYIADSGNHAIRRISPSGLMATFAGNGFPGSLGDGGPAAAAFLNGPSGVAVDAAGDVFIADSRSHRVRRVRGGVISTFAGNGAPGLAFEGFSAVLAQLNDPRALAVDAAGNLYIADAGNNRIRRVDASGILSTFGEPVFSGPRGVAVTPAGEVYVADSGNHRVCRLIGSGIVTVAGTGAAGFSGDGGPGAEARLHTPAALAVDALGNIAVADHGNARVRQLRPQPLLISVLEQGLRVSNAASALEGPIAPGMLATLLGPAIGPVEPLSAPGGAAWPAVLGEVTVSVGGEAAPLLYVSSGQVNFQVPASVAGRREVRIEVFYRQQLRGQAAAPVVMASPALFPQIIHEDGTLNGAANAAGRGAIVLLYATGMGLLLPESVEVSVGGMPSQVLWTGPAPGLPGLWQVNLRLPSGFFPPGAHPIVLRAGGIAAPPGVTVHLY